MASSLTHFCPPHHLVRTQGSSQQFTCDLCHTSGNGSHYRCQACNFDLHDHCVQFGSPHQTINFFAHPWHELDLQQGHGCFCDLCKQSAGDVFYRCIFCGFNVHPNCTTTKQVVHTSLHEHPLCLVPGEPKCNVCDKLKGFWLYRCGICNFNLHIECLHAPEVSIHSAQSITSSTQQISHGHGQAYNTSSMPGMLHHPSSMPGMLHHPSSMQGMLHHSSSMPAMLNHSSNMPPMLNHSSNNTGNMIQNILVHLGCDITVDSIGEGIFDLFTNN